MTAFTPWSGLAGGLLIGASAVILLASIGRLAGISNIAHGALQSLWRAEFEEASWRLVFLLGLVLGASGFFWASGLVANTRTSLPSWMLILGGLLVGWGTSQGNGCTSGHGVCGLGRLSMRSLWATLTFMATGTLTVFLVRHVVEHI